MNKRYYCTIVYSVLWLAMAGRVLAEDQPATDAIAISDVQHDGPVHFESEILPILRKSCLACHNSTTAEADLVLETPQSILTGGNEGPAAVRNNSAESLFLKVASHQVEPHMPPEDNQQGAKPLTPDELGLIKLWIDQGAQGEVKGLAGPIAWQPLPTGVNPIYAVAISPHGNYVAAGRANQIFLYHAPTKTEIGRLTDSSLVESGIYDIPGVAHLDLVQSLAFSADGKWLASGGYRTVKIWKKSDSARVAELPIAETEVQALVASPAGNWAAVAEAGGTIKLIDLATRQVIHTLVGHEGPVHAIAFTADGGKLVSGGEDRTIRVFDTADGNEQGKLETPVPVRAVALIQAGKQIATGGEDNTIRTWAFPGQGEPVPLQEWQGHGGPITSLAAVPPNGDQLVSGSQDGTVRLWDVQQAVEIRQMAHGSPVTAVAVRPDGQHVATAGDDGLVKLWNVADGTEIALLDFAHNEKTRVEDVNRAIALAKRHVDNSKQDLEQANKRKTDEEEAAKKAAERLNKADEEFKKKDEANKSSLAEKEAADSTLEQAKTEKIKANDAKTQADQQAKLAEDVLAAAKLALQEAETRNNAAQESKKQAEERFTTTDTKLKESEENAKQKAEAAQKVTNEKNLAEREFQNAMRSDELSKSSLQKANEAVPVAEMVLQNREGELKQREGELQTAQESVQQRTENQVKTPMRAIAYSLDGSLLSTVGDDQCIRIWGGDRGVPVHTISAVHASAVGVAFAASGDVLTAGADRSLAAWDPIPDWQLALTIGDVDSPEHLVDRVTALHFDPSSQVLAAGSGEPTRSGQLKIWNVKDGELVGEVNGAHSDSVLGLEFSPDGKHIASCGADRMLRVFDVASGNLIKTFEGHTHHVLGVSWRADGRMLASGGSDKVVKVWNFRTGERTHNIGGFGKEVTSIQFVGTGDNMVCSSGSKQVTAKNVGGGNVRDYGGPTDFMYCVRASADGNTIVAGGHDSVVRVWRESGEELATFAAP